MIPYGQHDISPEDIEAVVKVLQSDFLTQGPVAPEFEQSVAEKVGTNHALAVNSATSALHIACMSLDLGPSDWLWTSPNTFVASANCALYCGAKVDFVDIDPRTYNLCPLRLEDKLIEAEILGKLPKIVIPVHLAGQSCDMAAISALSQKYGFKIVEDASHAIGGRYRDEFIGCGKYSDITVFSFHPVKIVTSAEGGVALTESAELANRLALFRSHGVTRDPAQMTHSPKSPWYYEQIDLGYNYRMTELQAALGLSQLQRLDTYVTRRNQLARRYDQLLADLPVTTPWRHPDCYSAFHLYVIRLDLSRIKGTHRQVFEALRAQGIGVQLHYIPVHTHPYFLAMGFALGDFPEAERYYEEAISLPIYPALNEDQQAKVVHALNIALSQ